MTETNNATELTALDIRAEAILSDDLTCKCADDITRKSRIHAAITAYFDTYGKPHPYVWNANHGRMFVGYDEVWDLLGAESNWDDEDIIQAVEQYRAAPRPFSRDIKLAMEVLWPRMPSGTALHFSTTIAPTHIVILPKGAADKTMFLGSGINQSPAWVITRAFVAAHETGAAE